MEVVKEHAQWRNPELKPRVKAHNFSAVERVDGAISACVADACNRALGRELSSEEERQHVDLAKAAKLKELNARKKFDVFE